MVGKLLAGAAIAAALGCGAAWGQDRPEGLWVAQSGNVEVRIGPCGAALCGDVVRVMANNSMSGPGASTAAPPRVGLHLMTGFTPSGQGQWTGRIFNREDGRTYDCVITPGARTMEVRPYIWLPLFGRSQLWTRVG